MCRMSVRRAAANTQAVRNAMVMRMYVLIARPGTALLTLVDQASAYPAPNTTVSAKSATPLNVQSAHLVMD